MPEFCGPIGPAVPAFVAFVREAASREAKLDWIDLENGGAIRRRKAGLPGFGSRIG